MASLTGFPAAAYPLHSATCDITRAYDIMLEALGDALDLKDPATAAHCKRVTAFTIAIAETLDLSVRETAVIARGAFLHDIGKIATPGEILRKTYVLHPDEMGTMREHPYHGYRVIKKIPALADAAEIVYAHHEDFDGTGYPRGLKGEEIPLGARIVAVANTLDSMTFYSPYRPAQTLSAAREEIQRCSGSQFDPDIVRVFLTMPENIWGELRAAIGP